MMRLTLLEMIGLVLGIADVLIGLTLVVFWLTGGEWWCLVLGLCVIVGGAAATWGALHWAYGHEDRTNG